MSVLQASTTEDTEQLRTPIENGDHIEIDRVNGRYVIREGNPLTGFVETEVQADSLKINGFAVALDAMEIGEHQQTVTVVQDTPGGLANIILDRD